MMYRVAGSEGAHVYAPTQERQDRHLSLQSNHASSANNLQWYPSSSEANHESNGGSANKSDKLKRLGLLTTKMRSVSTHNKKESANATSWRQVDRPSILSRTRSGHTSFDPFLMPSSHREDAPPIPPRPLLYNQSNTSMSPVPAARSSDDDVRTPSPPARLSSKKGRRRSGILQTLVASVAKGGNRNGTERRERTNGFAQNDAKYVNGNESDKRGEGAWTIFSESHHKSQVPSVAYNRHKNSHQRLGSQTTSAQLMSNFSHRPSSDELRHSSRSSSPTATLVRRLSKTLRPPPHLSSRPTPAPVHDQNTSTGNFALKSFRHVRNEELRQSIESPRRSGSTMSFGRSYMSIESPSDEFQSPMRTPFAAPDSPYGTVTANAPSGLSLDALSDYHSPVSANMQYAAPENPHMTNTGYAQRMRDPLAAAAANILRDPQSTGAPHSPRAPSRGPHDAIDAGASPDLSYWGVSDRSLSPEARKAQIVNFENQSSLKRANARTLSGSIPPVVSNEAKGPALADATPALVESPNSAKTRAMRRASGSIPVGAFRKAVARSASASPFLLTDDETALNSPAVVSASPSNGHAVPGPTMTPYEYVSPPAMGTRSPAEELAALEAALPRNRTLMLMQRDRSVEQLLSSEGESDDSTRPKMPGNRDSPSSEVNSSCARVSPKAVEVPHDDRQGAHKQKGLSQETSEMTEKTNNTNVSGDTEATKAESDLLSSILSTYDTVEEDRVPFPQDKKEVPGDQNEEEKALVTETAEADSPQNDQTGVGLSTMRRSRHGSSASLSARERRDEVKAFHQQHAQALSKALAHSKAQNHIAARIAWPPPPCVDPNYHANLTAIHQHSLYTQHCRAADSALNEYMRLMAGVVPPEVMVQPGSLFPTTTERNHLRDPAVDVKRSRSAHNHSKSQSMPPSQGATTAAPRRRSLVSIRDSGGGSGGFGKDSIPPLPIAPIPPLLTLVTGSNDMLREVKSVLIPEGDPIRLFLTNTELDLPEIQGSTKQVALTKCKAAADKIKGPCLIEDTALAFAAFGELPGPYIKDFTAALGIANLVRLLYNFSSNTSATAVCTFGLSMGPRSEPVLFEGRVDGTIVPPRGDSSLGWDCIFQPKGSTRTFGEMRAEAKATISHRGRALAQVRSYLRANPVRIEVGGTAPGKPYSNKIRQLRDSASTFSSPQAGSSDVHLMRSSQSAVSIFGSEKLASSPKTMPSSPTAPSSTGATTASTPKQGGTMRRHRGISAALVDKARGSLRRGSAGPASTLDSHRNNDSLDDAEVSSLPRRRTASVGH